MDITERQSKGETAIVVAVEGQAVGLLFAADTVRPAAGTAVTALARKGLTVRVASGDSKEAVWAAAAAIGLARENTNWGATPGSSPQQKRIDTVDHNGGVGCEFHSFTLLEAYSSKCGGPCFMTPTYTWFMQDEMAGLTHFFLTLREFKNCGAADKASIVRSIQARGEIVMVVGDGVNDAPALAAADVGVAMRAGTGSAMDAADIVLMRDDIRGAEMAIDVSRLTMRKVPQALVWYRV